MRKVARCEPSEALAYLRKARQFGDEARAAADGDRPDAAMLCAIHAAISATDAVTIALSGLRSTDPNHLAAADLLRDAGRGSEEFEARARQLVTLLQKKNVVEYDGRNARESEAEDAVKRAERILDWASAIVGKSGGVIS